jgi:hypothetical protein
VVYFNDIGYAVFKMKDQQKWMCSFLYSQRDTKSNDSVSHLCQCHINV